MISRKFQALLAIALAAGPLGCIWLDALSNENRGGPSDEVASCDAPARFTIRPTSLTLKPGERRSVEWEVFVLPSGTASATVDGGALEPNGTNSVTYVAPLRPGSYTLTVTRDACPGVSASIPITVVALDDPGPAPGSALTGISATSAAWSSDGTRVAFAGVGGVWLFSSDGTFVDSLKLAHRGPFVDVAFAPDGKGLAVAGDAGEFGLTVRTEGMVPEAKVGRAVPQALVYSADGKRLYLHMKDKIDVVDLATGATTLLCPLSVPTLGEPRYRLDLGPLGSLVAAAPGELREASTGRQMARWHDGSFVNAAAIAPDLTWAMIGGSLRHPFYAPDGRLEGGGAPVAISGDASLVATAAFEKGVLQIFRVVEGAIVEEKTFRLMNGRSEVHDLAWSPSGGHLAVASSFSSYVLTRAQLGF